MDTGLLLNIDIKKQQLKELYDYFLARDFRSIGYDNHGNHNEVLCWNIKVYRADHSGKSGSEPTNKKWDALWEEYIEKDDGFFWRCCEAGLGFAGNKKNRDYDWHDGIPEIEKCDYVLQTIGRSGGWLVLEEFNGYVHNKDDFEEIDTLIECCGDDYEQDQYLCELEDRINRLLPLKLFCESLDKFNATEEWNHQCNYYRSEKEYEWESGNFDCLDDDTLEQLLEKDLPRSVKSKIKNYLKGVSHEQTP